MPKKPTKKKTVFTEQVQPLVYARIFGRDKDGKAILAELNRIYYNQATYAPGRDALEATFREGQRSVVAILNRKTNREEE